jgi:hypothetical protein
MLIMSPELSSAIALNDMRLFRAQILYMIMNVRQSPEDLLKGVQAFHSVNEVIKLYED